jgi:SNF2 family DNA or RNA helicase
MNLARSARMYEHYRQAEDRIYRVKHPVEVFQIIADADVDEYVRKHREDREILDKIIQNGIDEVTDD